MYECITCRVEHVQDKIIFPFVLKKSKYLSEHVWGAGAPTCASLWGGLPEQACGEAYPSKHVGGLT